jgi:quinol monooxygenase YgiN
MCAAAFHLPVTVPDAAFRVGAKEHPVYITRVELTANPGRIREVESFLGRVFDILKQQQGFLRGGAVGSLGYPGRYTTMAVWESREVAEAGRRSDQLQTFLAASGSTGIATTARPLEAYEVVERIQDRDISEAGFIAVVDIAVDIAQARAFEDRARQLLELRQKFGHGIVSNTIARFLGGPGRYMMYNVHTDQESADRTRLGPEVQKFNEEHPLAEIGGAITNVDLGSIILTAVPAFVR